MTEDTTTKTYCDGHHSDRQVSAGVNYYSGPFREAVKMKGWIKRDGKHYCQECAKERAG